jgi:hypothetical protein
VPARDRYYIEYVDGDWLVRDSQEEHDPYALQVNGWSGKDRVVQQFTNAPDATNHAGLLNEMDAI